jgi:regulator of RNase E activity RraA
LRQDIDINGVAVKNGDWIMGDDNGVLVVPIDHVMNVLSRAENVESTERRIREAIRNGMSLFEARKKFRYDQPWLAKENN